MVKVISVTGKAWARDAEGNLRELRAGDTIQPGEELVTSDAGSAQLDFGDGTNPVQIDGGEEVAVTPELAAEAEVDASEFAALDRDLEALLAALDDDIIDLLDVLDATAAGAGPGGAADGGHSFVRLARIAEDVNPLAFEYGLGQASELPEIEGGATQSAQAEEGGVVGEDVLLPPGTITVSIGAFNSLNVTQVPLTGATTNVPAGSVVTLVITDQAGNTVTTTATVDAEGNYRTEVDLSELVDGPITVDARVVDQTGATQTAEDGADKDTFAEATITIDVIAGDDVIDGEEAKGPVTITGTVGGDAREGDTVTLTVGGETFTGTVTSDLTYAIVVPGELLAENSLVTAEVSGSDDAGNPYSADSERPYQVVPDIVQVGPEADPAIGNVIVTEGESAVFKVVLSNASPHSNTYALQLKSGTATLGEDFTDELTLSNGVTYDPSTGLITVPAGVTEFTVTVPTIDDDLVEDTETFTLTVGNVTGTGTILDNDVTDGSETVSTLEDTPVSGNVLDNAESNVGELSVTGFEVAGIAYQAGETAVIEGKGSLTIEADGTYHFTPFPDYSDQDAIGPMPQITYTVTNGLKTVNSTLEIAVTPVADTPDVSITLAPSGPVVLTLGGPNVNDPQGFSVEAFKNGGAGEISIRSSGSPTGFGVAGPASDGADAEIGNGESLLVTLDTPAQSVSFQLAWLSTSEYAKYTVHYTDGSSESFVISGNTPEGGFDGIGEATTRQAPEGKWIAGIEFSTPAEGEPHFSGGNDYLVHQVSYVAATAYDVEIVATPTDIDFSESIVAVTVAVPEGVTLSAGERNADGTWTLPLESEGSYTVSVDPDTQEVTITGLVMIVPIDYTGPVTLTVTATAQDGDDTADGTASVTAPMVEINLAVSVDAALELESSADAEAGQVAFTIRSETTLSGIDPSLAGEVSYAITGGNDKGYFVLGTDDDGKPVLKLTEAGAEAIRNGQFDPAGAGVTVTGTQQVGNFTAMGSDSAMVEVPVDPPQIFGLDGEGADVIVYEKYLEQGSSPSAEALPGQGEFAIQATGGIKELHIAGQVVTIDDLLGLSSVNPIVIETDGGNTIHLVGYEGNVNSGTIHYQFILAAPVAHPEQGPDSMPKEGTVSVKLVDKLGQESTGETIRVDIVDDVPEFVSSIETHVISTDGIPDILNGSFDFVGQHTAEVLSLDGFTVSARGFTSATDPTLTVSQVGVEGGVIGVKSVASPYHNLTSEVDFRFFGSGDERVGQSEELIFTLNDSVVAYTLKIEFARMFGGEKEVGEVDFYRDGVLVATKSFSSDASDGNYAANFVVEEGGFDKFILRALDNGVDNPVDNSDFAVKSVTFGGAPTPVAIGYVSGHVDVHYGADGFGSLALKGAPGSWQVTVADSGNSLVATDSDGELLFRAELTPSTGQWELYQYKVLEEEVRLSFKATDGDGDHAEQTVTVYPLGVGEILVGGDGDDVLVGSAGNDVFVGGLGDDVFKWNLNDQGVEGNPTKDIVKDFGTGHNVLDLAELLQGENEGNISGFIVAEQVGGDTVLYIKHDGGIATDGSNADQKVVLEGYGMEGKGSEDFLQHLLQHSQLNIDS
jgi:hypothetical protein